MRPLRPTRLRSEHFDLKLWTRARLCSSWHLLSVSEQGVPYPPWAVHHGICPAKCPLHQHPWDVRTRQVTWAVMNAFPVFLSDSARIIQSLHFYYLLHGSQQKFTTDIRIKIKIILELFFAVVTMCAWAQYFPESSSKNKLWKMQPWSSPTQLSMGK